MVIHERDLTIVLIDAAEKIHPVPLFGAFDLATKNGQGHGSVTQPLAQLVGGLEGLVIGAGGRIGTMGITVVNP